MKAARFSSILIVFLTVGGGLLWAQETVFSGKVMDAETKEPLPGVNVYLSGTTIGAATNPEGIYQFTTTLEGKMVMVVSFIGFKTQTVSLEVGQNPEVVTNFELEADPFELQEIKVVASNNEFLRRLDLFKTFFIGYDSNASKTFIENPEALDFEWLEERGEFKVTAKGPIIIFNMALGYSYEVELIDVRFNPETYGGFYRVHPRVSELDPRNRRQERRWRRNRALAFRGSSRHFFQTLYRGQLEDSKYTVHPRGSLEESNNFMALQRKSPNDWRYLINNYKMYTITSREFSVGYNLSSSASKLQDNQRKLSTMNLSGSGLFIINERGYVYNPEEVQFVGKWNNDRFSQFLPLDYEL
jgi:hypothetical protein